MRMQGLFVLVLCLGAGSLQAASAIADAAIAVICGPAKGTDRKKVRQHVKS